MRKVLQNIPSCQNLVQSQKNNAKAKAKWRYFADFEKVFDFFLVPRGSVRGSGNFSDSGN